MSVLLSIDAGTSSVRVIAFDHLGTVLDLSQREVSTSYLEKRRVEQDPKEILAKVFMCLGEVTSRLNSPVAAIGITNQRESFALLDSRTLQPLTPLVLWLDRSSEDLCTRLRDEGNDDFVRQRTGLPIDPYFSATKVADLISRPTWTQDTNKTVFATLDTLIVLALTNGASLVTDASNASRTLLFDTEVLEFSHELADLFNLSGLRTPEIVPSVGSGIRVRSDEIPSLIGVEIGAILGDQQSSLLGQGCVSAATAKNTYGTGSFVLANTGSSRRIPTGGLLGSIGWQIGEQSPTYVLEGAIYSTGATLRWMRDSLGLFGDYSEVGPLIMGRTSGGSVTFLPAFEGLGSPHMKPSARAAIMGLSSSSTQGDLLYAAVEAMAHQSSDVIEAMNQEMGSAISTLRVDGGASVLDELCQIQADLSGCEVHRSAISESTAYGAAGGAGVAVGIYQDLQEFSDSNQPSKRFMPTKSKAGPRTRRSLWAERMERLLRFTDLPN